VTCVALLGALPVTGAADDWAHWRGPNHNDVSVEKGWNATWPPGGPKVLWKTSVGYGFSSFAVVGDRVWTMGGAGDTDTVYCFDGATGRAIWKRSCACPTGKSHKGPLSTPTVHDGSVE